MPEEKGDPKSEADKEKKDTADEISEEEKEEDPFADIFDDEEEEENEDETETEEEETEEEETPKEKNKKKQAPPKRPTIDVGKIVEKQVIEAERRIERRSDATEFLNSDRGRIFGDNIQGFRDKLRQAAASKKYQGIPVSQLAAVILTPAAYEKALTTARQKADDEAADSVTVGGATRKTTVIPKELQNINPLEMDAKEFQQLVADSKSGKYRIKKQE